MPMSGACCGQGFLFFVCWLFGVVLPFSSFPAGLESAGGGPDLLCSEEQQAHLASINSSPSPQKPPQPSPQYQIVLSRLVEPVHALSRV